MIHIWQDKKRKSADGSRGLKEQRDRRTAKRLILGTAVLILAAGIAGGFAMHYAEQQRIQEEARQREEERQKEQEARKEQEQQLTPEEKIAQETAAV